jgi:hypothetical protein
MRPAQRLKSIVTLWRSLQYVIGKPAHGESLVSFTVPVSPRLQRLLKSYVGRGGLTGIIRRPIRRPAIEPSEPAERCSSPDFLHTNACGDFTLMARDRWFNLRGYPEFNLFSMNLDSVLCFSAHYAGVREEVLAEPMRIHRIEHGRGSGWTPEGR